MKIILRKDVEKVGRAGAVKNVAAGFARNYLFPRGLAMQATPEAVRWFEKGGERRAKLREGKVAAFREAAAKLGGVSLAFSRAVGDQGQLFGSVGRSDIVKSLKGSGFTVDKSTVMLETAIKAVGDFEVEIRLHPEVSAKVKVSVLARA